ncbi:winged helix-turn-helix transcriptional regulator [Haladaptatus sp. GCM10025707]
MMMRLSSTCVSRTDSNDLLDHDGRATVFSVIRESPGICMSAVAVRADIPLSTTRHHIRVLERGNLVAETKIRGKRRVYASNATNIELAAALADEATAAVLDALSRLGPVSVSALADDLARDPSTVTHHLQRLAAAGLVERERQGRVVINALAGEAKDALAPAVREESMPQPRLMADGSGFGEDDC